MEYLNKSFLEQNPSSYKLNDYLALKPVEYKNFVRDYKELVDYSCMWKEDFNF